MNSNMRSRSFGLWNFSAVCLLALLSLSSLALAIEADIYEEDNSYYQARFLTLNGFDRIISEGHNFHRAGDEDWFMIKLLTGRKYSFEIKADKNPVPNSFSPVLDFYGYDNDNDELTPIESFDPAAVPTNLPEGYYYVRIRNSDPNVFGIDTGYSFILKDGYGQNNQGLFYGFVYDADTKVRIPNAKITIVSNQSSWTGSSSDGNYSGWFHSGFLGFYMSPTLLGTDFTITVDAGINYDGIYNPATPLHINAFNFIKWVDIYVEPKNSVSRRSFYRDGDNDGKGIRSGMYECMECTPPSGYCENCASDTSTDCDDGDSSVHPNADEICGNGKDDNCDGRVDESACIQEGSSATSTIATTSTTISQATTTTTSITTFQPVTTTTLIVLYRDADGDGYGNPGDQISASVLSAGWIKDNTDCNDADKNEHPGQLWYKDADDDKYSDGGFARSCLRPSGYKIFSELSATSGDCNDSNPSINPGAKELCNGLDDNCNGQYEEGLPKNTYYRDADGDGYGHHDITTIPYCTAPVGFVENNSDCDDSDPAIHPDATEICNDKDDNCNGEIDEGLRKAYCRDADGDGFGDPNEKKMFCSQPDGYTEEQFCDDCDDADPEENPLQVWFKDKDSDGYSDGEMSFCERAFPYYYLSYDLISSGSDIMSIDCDDDDPTANPTAAESCNGKDDNCNGEVDEGVMLIFYRDADNDGYGNPHDEKEACEQPEGYVANNTDCDDTNPKVYHFTYCKDADGDGYGSPNDPIQACSPPAGYVEAELCNDCDDTDPGINPVSLGNAVSILKILTGAVICHSDAKTDCEVCEVRYCSGAEADTEVKCCSDVKADSEVCEVNPCLTILTGCETEYWLDADGDGKASLNDVIFILEEL